MSGGHALLRGCPVKLWMSHPRRYSQPGWMGPWGAWSRSWQPCLWQWIFKVPFTPDDLVIQRFLTDTASRYWEPQYGTTVQSKHQTQPGLSSTSSTTQLCHCFPKGERRYAAGGLHRTPDTPSLSLSPFSTLESTNPCIMKLLHLSKSSSILLTIKQLLYAKPPPVAF